MNFRKEKKIIIIISIGVLLLAAAVLVFLLRLNIFNDNCLDENEIVKYEISRKNRGLGDLGTKIVIFVFDKKTNVQKYSFQIDDIFYNYRPVETQRCYIYAMRMFNYDYHQLKQRPGFRIELWKYSYNNQEKQIALLAENTQIGGTFFDYYSYDFRVDPTEKYIALTRGYKIPEHAVIIKSLETLKDDFVLPYADLIKNYPDWSGYQIDMNGWTKDGKYYWGDISDTAYRLAFFRIEAGTWKWEVFPAPEGIMGGDALNPERGMVTYRLGAPWTADADFDQMYREEWKKEGKKVPFYVYNLITKEKTLLAEIDDPIWYFKPKWISDTELEYYLPGDKRGVYEVK